MDDSASINGLLIMLDTILRVKTEIQTNPFVTFNVFFFKLTRIYNSTTSINN